MQTSSVRTGSTAAITPRNNASAAVEAEIRPTAYYPDSSALEGGFNDRRGAPLKGHSLNEYLRMSPEQQANTYVAVAMDGKIPYGTRMRIPELEQKMNGGRPINFKVVDTGGAFQGKGTQRMDICVENEKASHNPLLNQTDRPKQGLSSSLHVIFPDGLKAVSGGTTRPSTGGMLKKGASGAEVKDLQNQLNTLGYSVGQADGKFGPNTEAAVKKFQAAQGLTADGVVGPKTREALKNAMAQATAPKDGFETPGTPRQWKAAPALADVQAGKAQFKEGMQGAAVTKLQQLLGIQADGKFGPATKAAVDAFQKSAGLTPGAGNEGVVGKTTLEALEKAAQSGSVGSTGSVGNVTPAMRKLAQAGIDAAMSLGGYTSHGLCATGVSKAIQSAYGFKVYGNGNQIDDNLPRSKFKQIDIPLSEALKIPGLVLTWEKTSTRLGSIYGHTAITTGDGHSSASDFIERDTLAGNAHRSGLKIFMPTL